MVFGDLMAEILPKLMTDIKSQFLEGIWTQSKIKQMETTPTHIRVKLRKRENTQSSLQSACTSGLAPLLLSGTLWPPPCVHTWPCPLEARAPVTLSLCPTSQLMATTRGSLGKTKEEHCSWARLADKQHCEQINYCLVAVHYVAKANW